MAPELRKVTRLLKSSSFGNEPKCLFWQPLEAVGFPKAQFIEIITIHQRLRLGERWSEKEFRSERGIQPERSAVCSAWWARNNVNGSLVGWWMCKELCFSRAQEVRAFLHVLVLPNPLISGLLCNMFYSGKNTNIILPPGRIGNICICQNGGNTDSRARMIPMYVRRSLDETLLQKHNRRVGMSNADRWIYMCVCQ